MFFTDKHALYYAHKHLPKMMCRASSRPTIDQLVNLHAGIGYYPDAIHDRRDEQIRILAGMMRMGPGYYNSNMRDVEAQSRFAARHLHGRVNREYREEEPVKNQHFYLSARWQRKLLFQMFMRHGENELWQVIEKGSKAPCLIPGSPLASWVYHTAVCDIPKNKQLRRAYRRKVWERIHGR